MSDEEITVEILEWLQLLRTKPKMIIPFNKLNYELVATYVEGYLHGIGLVIGRDLLRNIHNWHCEQRKNGIATVWVLYIRYLHEGASDDELINFLLDDIEMYFNNNPAWHKEDIPYRWQFGQEGDGEGK